jgi:fumarate hydratase class II
MVAIQVIGNDTAIGIAGSQGNFELNVFKPIMIFNFLHSILLLKDSVQNFEKFCVEGLKVNRKQLHAYVENSLMLVTALSPVIGYDKCAKIAHLAFEKDLSLREACLQLGYLSEEKFDQIVIPEKMTNH